ncbi:MAG: NADH-quinone oxidoreductase subunit L, partial [Anaerolineae bacterium]|nr:NADH-quinone oxidoreductase subunit L [Anaerolineae bacterium]
MSISLSDLAWLIPAGPFLAFVLITLGGHRSRRLSKALALAGMIVAVVLSQVIFWSLVRVPETQAGSVIHWFSQGVDSVGLGIFVDPTDAVMVAMVSFVCLMIFVYSLGYMRDDPKVSRFFAYVSLFAGAMLGAMVCDNLLAFFVFWEIMGAC